MTDRVLEGGSTTRILEGGTTIRRLEGPIIVNNVVNDSLLGSDIFKFGKQLMLEHCFVGTDKFLPTFDYDDLDGYVYTGSGTQKIFIDHPSWPGVIKFNNMPGLPTQKYIYDCSTCLPIGWKIDFEYIWSASDIPRHIILGVLSLDDNLLDDKRILVLHGPTSDILQLSYTGLESDGVALTVNTRYYCSVEDLKDGRYQLSVFTDSARTIHETGSPKIMDFGIQNGLKRSLSTLRYLRHGSINSSVRKLTAEIDNLVVTDAGGRIIVGKGALMNDTLQLTSIDKFLNKTGSVNLAVNTDKVYYTQMTGLDPGVKIKELLYYFVTTPSYSLAGLYADNGANQPGNLLYDAGIWDPSTNGFLPQRVDIESANIKIPSDGKIWVALFGINSGVPAHWASAPVFETRVDDSASPGLSALPSVAPANSLIGGYGFYVGVSYYGERVLKQGNHVISGIMSFIETLKVVIKNIIVNDYARISKIDFMPNSSTSAFSTSHDKSMYIQLSGLPAGAPIQDILIIFHSTTGFGILGLYDDNGANSPNNLLYDSGDIAPNSWPVNFGAFKFIRKNVISAGLVVPSNGKLWVCFYDHSTDNNIFRFQSGDPSNTVNRQADFPQGDISTLPSIAPASSIIGIADLCFGIAVGSVGEDIFRNEEFKVTDIFDGSVLSVVPNFDQGVTVMIHDRLHLVQLSGLPPGSKVKEIILVFRTRDDYCIAGLYDDNGSDIPNNLLCDTGIFDPSSFDSNTIKLNIEAFNVVVPGDGKLWVTMYDRAGDSNVVARELSNPNKTINRRSAFNQGSLSALPGICTTTVSASANDMVFGVSIVAAQTVLKGGNNLGIDSFNGIDIIKSSHVIRIQEFCTLAGTAFRGKLFRAYETFIGTGLFANLFKSFFVSAQAIFTSLPLRHKPNILLLDEFPTRPDYQVQPRKGGTNLVTDTMTSSATVSAKHAYFFLDTFHATVTSTLKQALIICTDSLRSTTNLITNKSIIIINTFTTLGKSLVNKSLKISGTLLATGAIIRGKQVSIAGPFVSSEIIISMRTFRINGLATFAHSLLINKNLVIPDTLISTVKIIKNGSHILYDTMLNLEFVKQVHLLPLGLLKAVFVRSTGSLNMFRKTTRSNLFRKTVTTQMFRNVASAKMFREIFTAVMKRATSAVGGFSKWRS